MIWRIDKALRGRQGRVVWGVYITETCKSYSIDLIGTERHRWVGIRLCRVAR